VSIVIVHVIADLTTGGAEMMLKRLIVSHQGQSEFEHHVVSLRSLGPVGLDLQAMGVPVHALQMKGLIDIPASLFRLFSIFRGLRPDIVHAWMYHANLLGGLAARLSGCGRVIWGIRATSFDASMGVSRATTWLRRLSAPASRAIPAVIVYVAKAARVAHEAIGYAAERGLVIPNGYPVAPARRPLAARASLGIPKSAVTIGSVGRFNAAKDPHAFVEAAARVARVHPDTRFLMVGRGISADNSKLISWINAHGLRDQFILREEQKDVYECLAAMDIFSLHSVTEAFPNVVAEAMNASLPCVVTDVGDVALLVGDAGIVVPPRNPAAMAIAINELIEAGPSARERIGAIGRERIRANYSIGVIVRRYEKLYCDLVEDPRVRSQRS
jgi:glycosyltransferase involved in cell wall biosynthesis